MSLRQHSSNASLLQPYLLGCGYEESRLEFDIDVGLTDGIPLIAFAHSPHDSRSACIAVVDDPVEPEVAVAASRRTGAPLVFNCFHDQWQFWKQATDRPKLIETIAPTELSEFFAMNQGSLAPDVVYRAKTWARFDKNFQLNFVDLGLMPVVEEEAGTRLSALIERCVTGVKSELGWSEISNDQGQWLLKSNFWLLAGKILRDKQVAAFAELDLENISDVFIKVANHYGAVEPVSIGFPAQAKALAGSADKISRFSNLSLVTTEALSYLYENALVTKETRTELGTHSTPSYLVDYVTGKLRPWISEIPIEDRQVFEPACGHAAFLLSAMRLLSDLLPEQTPPFDRHAYLRDRLHGCDVDSFALEIARLRLTLADVPNPNGWNLEPADMFAGNLLARRSHDARIVLANPPFHFATSFLETVVNSVQPGAVFGVVLPQSTLQANSAIGLRKVITTDFEIGEISLFPDKVFEFSDVESALLIARRRKAGQRRGSRVSYRRVREHDLRRFRHSYQVTNERYLDPKRFSEVSNWSFIVPDLEEVWEYCSKFPRFSSAAHIGQGFQFRSRGESDFPQNSITESDEPAPGLVEGFARLRRDVLTHEQPDLVWLNLDDSVIQHARHGTLTDKPQVLLNYARVSRGPWRLKAFLDPKGHPVSSRFLAVRPLSDLWTLEALWALCNSPVANAYSYAFSGKRDVLAGLMRDMPIPAIELADSIGLGGLVQAYIKAAQSNNLSVSDPNGDQLRELLWRIDAEILRLYRLPVRLEHQLLGLFSGIQRRGVPFRQTEYFPGCFSDELSLQEFLAITADWEDTNERRVSLIHRKVTGDITGDDEKELNYLQGLTDSRIRLLAPSPIHQLEEIRGNLKRRAMWEGQ